MINQVLLEPLVVRLQKQGAFQVYHDQWQTDLSVRLLCKLACRACGLTDRMATLSVVNGCVEYEEEGGVPLRWSHRREHRQEWYRLLLNLHGGGDDFSFMAAGPLWKAYRGKGVVHASRGVFEYW